MLNARNPRKLFDRNCVARMLRKWKICEMKCKRINRNRWIHLLFEMCNKNARAIVYVQRSSDFCLSRTTKKINKLSAFDSKNVNKINWSATWKWRMWIIGVGARFGSSAAFCGPLLSHGLLNMKNTGCRNAIDLSALECSCNCTSAHRVCVNENCK